MLFDAFSLNIWTLFEIFKSHVHGVKGIEIIIQLNHFIFIQFV